MAAAAAARGGDGSSGASSGASIGASSGSGVRAVEAMFGEPVAADQEFRAVNVVGAPRPTLQLEPFDWPQWTSAACLNCAERINGRPLPLIVRRDGRSGRYVPDQAMFCCTRCQLAYIKYELRDATPEVEVLTREVDVRFFDCKEPLAAGPPRVALAKFSHSGDGMSIAEYRGTDARGTSCLAYLKPPFVTATAVVQCQYAAWRRQHAAAAADAAPGAATTTADDAAAPAASDARASGAADAAAPPPPLAVSESVNRVRGLQRPTERALPLAPAPCTGKPPLILAFLAAKWREMEATAAAAAPPLPPAGSGLPPPSLVSLSLATHSAKPPSSRSRVRSGAGGGTRVAAAPKDVPFASAAPPPAVPAAPAEPDAVDADVRPAAATAGSKRKRAPSSSKKPRTERAEPTAAAAAAAEAVAVVAAEPGTASDTVAAAPTDGDVHPPPKARRRHGGSKTKVVHCGVADETAAAAP